MYNNKKSLKIPKGIIRRTENTYLKEKSQQEKQRSTNTTLNLYIKQHVPH